MRYVIPRLAVALLSLCVAAGAHASALNKNFVAADARWIAHFDVEAFLKSRLGEYVTNHPQEFDLVSGMSEIEAELGINPLEDIRSVTFYGTQGMNDAVAIADASENIDSLLDSLREQDGFEELTIDGYVLYTWTEKLGQKDDEGEEEVETGDDDPSAAIVIKAEDSNITVAAGAHMPGHFLAIHRGIGQAARLLVGGTSPQHVISALKVLDRKTQSMLDTTGPAVVAAPQPGSIFFMASAGIDALAHDVHMDSEVADLAKRATQLSVDSGESQGVFYSSLAVATGQDDDATHLAQVVQGLIALAHLSGHSEPEMQIARKLMAAVKVTAEAKHFSAEFRYDSEKLIQLLQSAAQMHHQDDPDQDIDDE